MALDRLFCLDDRGDDVALSAIVKVITLDCDCAERAEGIASAIAHGGRTDDYSGIYYIVTTTANGTPLRHPSEQVKCMLDELFKEKNSLLTRIIGWTKGKHYGCSYARYPESVDEGNVSLALTCIFYLEMQPRTDGFEFESGKQRACCTSLTRKQAPTVADFFNKEFQKRLPFDCDCAERAEGLAYFLAIGAATQDYSDYYNIYNITQIGGNDKLDAKQMKSMLEALVKANPEMKTPTPKGGRYGCAFSSGKKMGDNNVTHALTCVFACVTIPFSFRSISLLVECIWDKVISGKLLDNVTINVG
ncbi:unnamed protein product [Nippostrongylus brasiliensis]|uniref:Ankyrin repeat protein n=1 Tax=Nippostrongylus brasiliensis TaxID=27835 RepID=A0A0N4Y9I4_NIPBR|nr:unnamed protein product [Nippostrongylus brasiliensis]